MSRWALHHGDALRVLHALPDASVDAVITDPPYSSGGAMRGDRMAATSLKYVMTGTDVERAEFAGDTRDSHGFRYWESLWLAECLRIAKPGAPVCVFTDWRQLAPTTDAIQAGGWVFRGVAPWDKTEGARPTMGRFRSQCEFVVWGSKGPMSLDDDRARAVGVLPGCFRYGVKQDDKHHMTGKPTELMREIVRICPPGGVVLDPFSGSGTTLVAALMEGRGALGVEMVAEYVEIARQRLVNVEAGKPPVPRAVAQEALPLALGA